MSSVSKVTGGSQIKEYNLNIKYSKEKSKESYWSRDSNVKIVFDIDVYDEKESINKKDQIELIINKKNGSKKLSINSLDELEQVYDPEYFKDFIVINFNDETDKLNIKESLEDKFSNLISVCIKDYSKESLSPNQSKTQSIEMTTTEMTTPESLGLRRTKKGISLTSSLGSETTDDSSLIMPRGEIKISMKDTLFNESVLLKESIEPKI